MWHQNKMIIFLLFGIVFRISKAYSFGNDSSKLQLLAWYFPQYHPFPENDKNWGEGFTDWSLVKIAPDSNYYGSPVRKPSELGYYNLLDKDIREKQGNLAREYGLDGFIFYHYWLENRGVMTEVLARRLLDGEPNLPFMLCMVNEAWQARFYNLKSKQLGNGETLLKMLFDAPEKLFDYLLPFFQHKDYITINEKPVYVVYRPTDSVAFENAIDKIRQLAVFHGFPGLHIVQCLQHFGRGSYLHHWADAGMEFAANMKVVDQHCGSSPPDGDYKCTDPSTYYTNGVPVSQAWSEKTKHNRNNIELISHQHYRTTHDLVSPRCVYNLQGHNKPVYRGGLVAWDATPRYPMKKGDPLPKAETIPPVMFASTTEKFLNATKSRLCKTLCDANEKDLPNFYAFFAWNEWGEGATLEPTQSDGRAYLEALRDAKKSVLGNWPSGCEEECREMKRLRELKDCHAVVGCFEKFHCLESNNERLLNNEYGSDVLKGVNDSVDSGRGTYFDTVRLGLVETTNSSYASVHHTGWSAVVRQFIGKNRGHTRSIPNLLLVEKLMVYFYERKGGPILTPWIGVIHVVGELPESASIRVGLSLSIRDILSLENFQLSLSYCKGLITVSPHWQPWFAVLPELKQNNIAVFAVKHPMTRPVGGIPFSVKSLIENKKKNLILIGHHYLRVAPFYSLNTTFTKVWMEHSLLRIDEELMTRHVPSEQLNSVEIRKYTSLSEYLSFLRSNLILIDAWTASYNSAVMECMKLGIPMLVRKLEAVVDYLGDDYPLYFQSSEELEGLLVEEGKLEELLAEAHHYLMNLDISEFSLDRFNIRMDDVLKQITLPQLDFSYDNEKLSLLVIVPRVRDSVHVLNTEKSILKLLGTINKEIISFRCEVQIDGNLLRAKNIEGLDSLRSLCQLKESTQDWASFFSQVMDPPETHVAVLRHDVSLTEVNVTKILEKMDTYGFDISSPTIDRWYHQVMQPREGCSAHRTDYVDFDFTVFRRIFFLCLQSHLNPKINKYGKGYGVTLASICQARIGVFDDQRLQVPGFHGTEELPGERDEKTRMCDHWIEYIMDLKGDDVAEQWWNFVTKIRPKEFPYCQVVLPTRGELLWVTVPEERNSMIASVR